MASEARERVLEILADLDAHLAGLEVAYSDENATAARAKVAALEEAFETNPETLETLRDAVEELVASEDPDLAARAVDLTDELRRQVERGRDG